MFSGYGSGFDFQPSGLTMAPQAIANPYQMAFAYHGSAMSTEEELNRLRFDHIQLLQKYDAVKDELEATKKELLLVKMKQMQSQFSTFVDFGPIPSMPAAAPPASGSSPSRGGAAPLSTSTHALRRPAAGEARLSSTISDPKGVGGSAAIRRLEQELEAELRQRRPQYDRNNESVLIETVRRREEELSRSRDKLMARYSPNSSFDGGLGGGAALSGRLGAARGAGARDDDDALADFSSARSEWRRDGFSPTPMQ